MYNLNFNLNFSKNIVPPTIAQGLTTQTVTVNEFESVNLTCAATGYPTPNISWVRVNGSPLPPPYNRYMYRVTCRLLTSYASTGCDT